MSGKPLSPPEAARALEITTRELMQLIHERKIRHIMVNGIAHVPPEAIGEYRSREL